MFDIECKGANAVIISTKNETVVLDPKLSVAGLKDLKVKDTVELATEERLAVRGAGEKLLIDGPGEYEVGNFSIKGIAAQRHIDTEKDEKLATIYRIEIEDVRIAVLGNVAPKLSDDQLEALGVVDILIVPVGGGGYTLDATSAVGVVRQVEPKAVIPVHFADKDMKYEVPQDTLETFNHELSAPVEITAKYKVKSAASLPETMTMIGITRTA
ncbi:MAG: MBL fold metallo-hydrolase [Candidatus Saccharimonadales bacterium]